MGLFSSETETYVATSISRLIKDELLPDSIRAAMAGALFAGTNIVDVILEGAETNLETKARRMYRYAEAHSPYGLPTGEVYTNAVGVEAVQGILDALEGEPVTVVYQHLGNPNILHMAWYLLGLFHGYDPNTNKLNDLSSEKGFNVYLEDMVVEIPENQFGSTDPSEIASWDIPANAGYTPERVIVNPGVYSPTPPVFGADIDQHRVLVKYVWEEKSKQTNRGTVRNIFRGSFYLFPTETDRDAEYFHAKYTANGQVKYWMYKKGFGVYPQLDSLTGFSNPVMGEFYPNIYFRLNKSNQGEDKSTQAYKAQTKMAKQLGLSYDTLLDAIHENPDIGVIQQAFLTFGVNADSTDPVDIQYLYSFFDTLYLAQKDIGSQPKIGYLQAMQDVKAIRIADSAFEMFLINNGIVKKRVAGNIGPVGTYQSAKTTIESSEDIRMKGVIGGLVKLSRIIKCRIYRKQISAGYYYEIIVVNPAMKYIVEGRHHTVVGDGDDELLVIPLDRLLIADFAPRDAERLYGRSLHLICNSLQEVEVEWYQQEWFSTVLLAAAVVATVASLGADGGFFVQAAAAIAAGSYVTLAVLIGWEILTYVAIQTTAKLVVKYAGVELAFLAAVVAAAYAPMAGKEGFATSLGQVTATELLFAANALASGVSAETQSMFKDLQNDTKEFDSYKESKLALLKDAEDELLNTSLLNPFVIFGEDPSTYFRRTVHTGNIGTLVYADLHNYVDRSLQLPNFSTTIGGSV